MGRLCASIMTLHDKGIRLLFTLLVCLSLYPAPAAPDVYFPSRLYVSGMLYHEPDTAENFDYRRFGYSVEAWYFDEVCIVSRTSPYLPSTGQPRFVHAYWYGDTGPGGDFRQQQWISPGMNPLVINDDDFSPGEAQQANPLWHLIHYRMRNWQNLESPVPANNQPATGTLVQLHDPPMRERNVNVSIDLNYLIDDDRISSFTYVVNTRQLSNPKSHPAESMVTRQLIASDFDENFPNVPRRVKVQEGLPNWRSKRVFEADHIDNIPADLTPQDVLDRLTADLARVHEVRRDGMKEPDLAAFTVINLMDGTRVSAQELVKDKFALIYSWASWAPDDVWNAAEVSDNGPALGIINRTRDLYEKFQSTPEVAIIGISFDADPEVARAYAAKHEMPWQNFLLPAELRTEAVAHFGNGKIPNVVIMSDSGELKRSGVNDVFGRSGNDHATTTALEQMVAEKRAATAAGGYARMWLGKDVVTHLENYDSVEVLHLTGDHTEELQMFDPPLPPPSAGLHLPAGPPPPMPRPRDMPTSIGLLLDRFPIVKSGKPKNPRAAGEIVKLLTDDGKVKGEAYESSYPSPERAILFRKGSDTVSLVYHGLLDVYLNDEQITSLLFSEEGNERFCELFRWLSKDAGLPPEPER